MIKILGNKDLLLKALQNLGFEEEAIATCLAYYDADQRVELVTFLQEHKQRLLEQLHLHQNQVDSLDYLVYKIKKSEI